MGEDLDLTKLPGYIGVKMITARPMDHFEFLKRSGKELPDHENSLGYQVFYPDGYVSWSPKEVFEEAYREIASGNMTFGLAIEALKKGKKVARKGWNGKDMFLFFQESSNIEPGVIRNSILKAYAEQFGGSPIYIRSHIDLKAADGTIAMWSPSGSDALADDWFIVD